MQCFQPNRTNEVPDAEYKCCVKCTQKKSKAKVVPLTGEPCARDGCDKPARGDSFCSSACCMLAHGLTLLAEGQ